MNLERIHGLPSVEFANGDSRILVEGELHPLLLDGVNQAVTRLDNVFGGRFYAAFNGLTIAILEGVVEGGGCVDEKQKYIQMDYRNNLLSVRAAEELLIDQGFFDAGERLGLSADPDKPAGIFPIELVHEIGHIVGSMAGKELAESLSPTKYGRRAPHESFAEAFTYYAFDFPQSPQAEQEVGVAIDRVLSRVTL